MISRENAQKYMLDITGYLQRVPKDTIDEMEHYRTLKKGFDVLRYLNGAGEEETDKNPEIFPALKENLSMPHLSILKYLTEAGSAKSREVEDVLGRSQSATSPLLNTLHSGKLLIRRRNGRQFEYVINPAYKDAIQSLLDEFKDSI